MRNGSDRPSGITFKFGPGKPDWIDIKVECGESECWITISDSLDPFDHMLVWLEAIIDRQFPSSFDVDDEGHVQVLLAEHYRDEIIRFVIKEPDYGERERPPQTYLSVLVDRTDLVRSLYGDFRRYAKWQQEQGIAETLRAAVAEGFRILEINGREELDRWEPDDAKEYYEWLRRSKPGDSFALSLKHAAAHGLQAIFNGLDRTDLSERQSEKVEAFLEENDDGPRKRKGQE